MTKIDIIKAIKLISKYAHRCPYSTAERTQQSIRLVWRLEDLIDKIENNPG